MAITRQEVDHIAHLSRIEITEAEKEEFLRQLQDILEHVNRLKQVDTGSVAPMHHVQKIKNVTRPDIVRPSLDKTEVFASAPSIEANGFKVPKII